MLRGDHSWTPKKSPISRCDPVSSRQNCLAPGEETYHTIIQEWPPTPSPESSTPALCVMGGFMQPQASRQVM
ncbi:hypothetical protein GBAR_LOCUS24217, partial [Geodia barretti]